MELALGNQLELVVSNSATSIQDLLDSQQDLFRSQIDDLENIVFTQCKLTGVNPLSQEMAAGALSIKIGKRPRDLLNPKAIKYMQSIFSIKDAIRKKETREISALFGVTATQVREFFTSQRSRVRKFIRLSREKATRSSSGKDAHDGIPLTYDPNEPLNPVPLDSLAPTSIEQSPTSVEQGPTFSKQDEVLPPVDELDKHFLENIFSLMRKEETFSGQVKLMEWILQVQNSSVLYWFLSKGGIMILATWLSQAVAEEQTSVLHVILKVLCHLPLQKALPVHMSAVLQSVNRLRFYRASDISNRARILLSRWSKAFARCQALKKTNGIKSASDAQDEMLLKQSINEVMSTESWDSKIGTNDDNSSPLDESSGNIRKLEAQPLKLLTASADDTNKKLISGVRSSQGKERRKVLLVEQPCQKSAGRSSQVGRSTAATQGRPLSADDIQKAKMRAHFMQSKYGKTITVSDESSQMQLEGANKSASSQTSILQSTPKAHIRHKIEEPKKSDFPPPMKVSNRPDASVDNKMVFNLDEPPYKRCKRIQIPWQTPPEIGITVPWRVGTGENSKEVEVQKNRILRERETVYKMVQEIPSDPKEPWDREIDYDDTLTPEIPTVQLPDVEGAEAPVSPRENKGTVGTSTSTSSSQNAGGRMPEPDLELLAVLLKNPELVFALTSGQAGNLSNDETVKLLDMVKANGLTSAGSLTVLDGKAKSEDKVEVSLPSPTPSSDPVTNGWKPDFAKNPFSRQKLMMKNETHDGPGIAATHRSQGKLQATSLVQPQILPVAAEQSTAVVQLAHLMLTAGVRSQERLPATNLVQPHIQPPAIIASQQSVTVPQTVQQLSLLQAALGLHEQSLPPVSSSLHLNVPAYASNIQLTTATTTELVPNTNIASVSSIPSRSNILDAAVAMQIETSRIVNTSTLQNVGGIPARPVGAPPTPVMSTPTPPWPHTQVQPSYAPPVHSWRPRQGLDPSPHYQSSLNQNNYNAYAGGPMQAPMPHGSWDLVDEPGFESWSPENSPTRAQGYNTPGLNFPDSRMNLGHSYRPERSMSGYRHLGKSGNKRWSDRRR